MKKALVLVMLFVVLFSFSSLFAQAKPGGSVTALVGSQACGQGLNVMSIGGSFTYFVNRYFGGGADISLGMKTLNETDYSTLAIDGYFAPRVEFDRGRLYPMVGLTLYKLDVEDEDYGTNVGFLFGLTAEIHYRKQFVLGTTIKNRLVIGELNDWDYPLGGPEVSFTVGLNF